MPTKIPVTRETDCARRMAYVCKEAVAEVDAAHFKVRQALGVVLEECPGVPSGLHFVGCGTLASGYTVCLMEKLFTLGLHLRSL